ncbi:hypothetical protein BJ165DRAFT_1409853 [Panaeolus papilionaceus]|nr:hypothetical protein BJ165DRAFT_1409837 [Panaeolus papilionaceus]KAF9034552.1 hypothetical protein BJ165DRAFT_1409853 [Panaeolus papilionaceus]
MSAWTPLVVPLSGLPASLQKQLQAYFEDFQSQSSRNQTSLLTRSATNEWKVTSTKHLVDRLQVQQLERDGLDLWIHKCTAIYPPTLEHLSTQCKVQLLIELLPLINLNEHDLAKTCLAQFQHKVEKDMTVQHNYLEDTAVAQLTWDSGHILDEENEDTDGVQSIQDLEMETQETQLKSNPVTCSPPRKKRKHKTHATVTHSSKHQVPDSSTLEDWKISCQKWSSVLQSEYLKTKKSETELTNDDPCNSYDRVVQCLVDIRLVPKTVYRTDMWKQLVKETNLAESILQWSSPSALFEFEAEFAKSLIRFHRIHESLLLVLKNWTPVTTSPASSYTSSNFPITSPEQKIKNIPSYIWKIITKNPSIIPIKVYPSAAFFLLKEENFCEACEQWLGLALNFYEKQNYFLKDKAYIHSTFSQLKAFIAKLGDNDIQAIQSPSWKTIITRTLAFNRKIASLGNTLACWKSNTDEDEGCYLCKNEIASKKCIQKIWVEINPVDAKYLGCGVSFSMVENLPDYFKQLDFWIYNALPEDILQDLIEHHHHLQTTKNLQRGSQFQSYSSGKMFPKGARQPQGGRKGDAYVFYKGSGPSLKSEDDGIDQLNTLFNDAEDTSVLAAIARIWNFPVYQELLDTTKDADKLGVLGQTLPLHKDQDAVRGLCAQYELQANKNGDEFGFMFADFGIYFVPRPNSAWSFSGVTTHGTILPSASPLEVLAANPEDPSSRSPNGGRVSNGIHVTATKTNIKAAEKYKLAREGRWGMQEYWSRKGL